MDTLKSLVNQMGSFADIAFGAASCAASLFILGTLAAPAWGVAVSLAGAGSAVMASSGNGLLAALGVVGLCKYLKS
jgi:hypothetical protein